MIVTCLCHGKGLVEIKCPHSICFEAPNAENLPYLKNVDARVCFKESHQYYSQIQAQIGILKASYFYFLVYTAHGSHYEPIKFNDKCLEHSCAHYYLG